MGWGNRLGIRGAREENGCHCNSSHCQDGKHDEGGDNGISSTVTGKVKVSSVSLAHSNKAHAAANLLGAMRDVAEVTRILTGGSVTTKGCWVNALGTGDPGEEAMRCTKRSKVRVWL